MNRTDLQILADDRVADAEALLLLGRWAGAYYLLGYAVECAFKACIAKQFREFEVPEKTLNNFYTHRLETLVIISHMEDILDNKLVRDPHFERNWETCLPLERGISLRSFDGRRISPLKCTRRFVIPIREFCNG